MALEIPLPVSIEGELAGLVEQYRARCLWFLRPDFFPKTTAEALRVLDYLERYGDQEAFRQAAAVRRWLSQDSSATSAGS